MKSAQLSSAIGKSVLILFFIFLPFLAFLAFKVSSFDKVIYATECFQVDGDANYGCSSYFGLMWLALLSLSASASIVGVTMSIVLRHRENPILLGSSYLEVGLFCFYGAVFGLFVLCLFVGGFVRGSLFPTISEGSFVSIAMRAEDWGKVAIWSFIAGFSERLLPQFSDALVNQLHRAGPQQERAVDLNPGEMNDRPVP